MSEYMDLTNAVLGSGKLGQDVEFTHILRRKTDYRPNPNHRPGSPWSRKEDSWKVWKREPRDFNPIRPDAAETLSRGIIVGKRTLQNGIRDWIGEEEGYAFYPKERITAYLVATDLHTNPVYVLPEDLFPVMEGL